MASLFSRDRFISHSRRASFSSSTTTTTSTSANTASTITMPSTRFSSTATSGSIHSLSSLPSPFGDLTPTLSSTDLRETAYEIFIAACRTSTGKPLAYNNGNLSSNSNSSLNGNDPHLNSSPLSYSNSSSSPGLQRSLTSTAASKMKKALGLRSGASSKTDVSSPVNSGGKGKKPVTIGELMRVQMRISDSSDSRIRRAMLRISAGQVGKRIESMVIPLELLQQFKSSDFTDQEEYDRWQKRNLKVLEAGLLTHPYVPLEKSNAAGQRLRQIIQVALDKPIETGRNNEALQVLRTAVMTLASRSSDGHLDACHWADGTPLNIRLYEMLLEACFDINEETSIIEEVDEIMELVKKTWGILGFNEALHNLCLTWVLFNRFVATGQIENDLLYAADKQLAEVAKDSKTNKDSVYAKILNSTLTSILGWAEKRLLAYHDTFVNNVNIDSMQSIVSLGVTSAKVLVEDISNEYRRRRKNEVDVARSRIDTYIRSSLRTAFAQLMEKVDSNKRASRNQPNSLPVLAILAKDVGELACKEKEIFSPILKKWHPFAAGVAVATLHGCYANELKQFIAGITELAPDAVKILRAADALEKDLVQIAVEDSVESDDGGKAIIREMQPFETEGVVINLVKDWIKVRVDRLKEWVDRNLQQEAWKPQSNQEGYAPSAIELLRTIDEILDAFFQLPIPTHPALLPDLITGFDRCLQYYIIKAKSGCGSSSSYIPTKPTLTRCTTKKKLQNVFKKKEKTVNMQKRNPQVATTGIDSFGIHQVCMRVNTFHRIRSELEVLEKRIITLLRNSESAHMDDFSNGLSKKFELTPVACVEGIQQLCESVAYKIVFHDLGHVVLDGLYIGDPSSSRVGPFLEEIEQKLTVIEDTVHERVRIRIVADMYRACLDGFLFVLLSGGPLRAFSRQDSQIIEEDFKSIQDLFFANGDGLPMDVINKFSSTVRDIIPLFKADTESLIKRFRQLMQETYGNSGKTRLTLPPTLDQWSPDDPNTILRVLCYRNDEAASKFLKKTYNLPKRL